MLEKNYIVITYMNRYKYFLPYKYLSKIHGKGLIELPSNDVVEQKLLNYQNPNNNYYDILGVTTDASNDEITKQFRKLSRIFHPDVYRGDSNSTTLQQNLNNIYQTLNDIDAKKKYDKKFRSPPEETLLPNNAYKTHRLVDIAGKMYAVVRTSLSDTIPFKIYKIDVFINKKNFSVKSRSSGLYNPITQKVELITKKKRDTQQDKIKVRNNKKYELPKVFDVDMYRKYIYARRRYLWTLGDLGFDPDPEEFEFISNSRFQNLRQALARDIREVSDYDHAINTLIDRGLFDEDVRSEIENEIDEEMEEEGVNYIFGITPLETDDIEDYISKQQISSAEEDQKLRSTILVNQSGEYFTYDAEEVHDYYNNLVSEWESYFDNINNAL